MSVPLLPTHLTLLYLICQTMLCAAQTRRSSLSLTSSPDTQISVLSCDQSVNKVKPQTVETCSYIKQYHSLSINYLNTQLSNAPSHHASRLHTSNISQRYDNALSPYLFQCYCAHRTFQAIVGSDKIAAEPTGLSFTP
jgi:hypothetical protein